MNKKTRFCIAIALLVMVLFTLNLLFGAVKIPPRDVLNILTGHGHERASWEYIVLQTRFPQAVTAMLCGGALAVSGLLLQTAFHNPLAGPSVFGINSGASLGVAFVMLMFGGGLTAAGVSLSGFFAVLAAAFVGATVVMIVLLLFSSLVKNDVMLLIIGIMIGYISNSAISLLNFFSTEEGVHSYMIWGLGNFGGVTLDQLPLFSVVTLIGLFLSLMLIKPLNIILLGERYAENLGVNALRLRNQLLVVTGLLTAITTAFCGPIAFIGLAVPHIARMLLCTDDHRYLIPASILTGSAMALLCNIICIMPGDAGIIPLNAVTPLMGAPVIVYVVVKRRRE